MNYIVTLRLFFTAIIATALALTAHILIQKHTMASPPDYPHYIVISAYFTAFLDIFILSCAYYFVGDTIRIKRKWLKGLALAFFILSIKMDLIRQLVMNYLVNLHSGSSHPLYLAALPLWDVWTANLLLALSLVYLCPTKKLFFKPNPRIGA
ncbi:MAG: hypothetical protein K0R66_69 [Gammaproteobacteria bacterium]|jgi:hypothetical protein|nr:hypothetical protein [Gammaproteobacteria bacterium]